MKTFLLLPAIALVAAMNFSTANADVVSSFDFTGGSTTGLTQGAGITGVTAINDELQIDGVQSTTGDTNFGTLTAALNQAINIDNFLSFDVVIPSTEVFDFTEIALDYSQIAPFDFGIGVFSSETGFNNGDQLAGAFANGFNSVTLASPIDLTGVTELQGLSGTTVEFRIYLAENSTSDTRIHVLDDIAVSADITSTSVPEPSSASILALAGLFGLGRRRKR